ncbi:hypothetical protein WJ0W_003297 [Paenibacillus melissococcoides]|uniref:Uncharacterized protein n=1 Tax=Paenibacillus melissococcoides TaxID=2912268 RepID=A0ABN8U4P7_9BACL|nr:MULTISPECIES: hypothetical protein [Paenibacillus]MEB9893267.1 hypothetical protein [Bacillus cereus]CAH8246060.1 hypothetical protein WJ0W_003297 [Paenibacillus melissococcoides]CAH8712856.1 hypothetical protein WDD9_003376 [Paenibacillus melissococcoides]CAH8713622.1 hypothetical protein HTL2_003679 [Paenibacillus melissococcoides]GIO78746.1 hypothetical protein J6TS7_23560 [Paenibacillus dendritiformis]
MTKNVAHDAMNPNQQMNFTDSDAEQTGFTHGVNRVVQSTERLIVTPTMREKENVGRQTSNIEI